MHDLPTSAGGNYLSHPVAIIPIGFQKGVREGTVYLQYKREGGSTGEGAYKCKGTSERNVDEPDAQ